MNSMYNSKRIIGRDDLTIYDIISVANLAKEHNLEYEINDKNAIGHISVKLIGISDNMELKKDTDMITNENVYVSGDPKQELQAYKCSEIKHMDYTQSQSGQIIKKVISITFGKM